MTIPNCHYCGRDAALVYGRVIYPRHPELAEKLFWQCDKCDAYVGCHAGTHRPLGKLANAELRAARIKAHAAFDPYWKAQGMTRRKGYQWLADQLGVSHRGCHISMFGLTKCLRVVEVVKAASVVGHVEVLNLAKLELDR